MVSLTNSVIIIDVLKTVYMFKQVVEYRIFILNFLDQNHNLIASCIKSHYAKADALLKPKMNELDLKVCLDDQEELLSSNFTNDCLIVKRVINFYRIKLAVYLIFYFIDENISNPNLLLKGCFFKES